MNVADCFKNEKDCIALGGSTILNKYGLLDREVSDVDYVVSDLAYDFLTFVTKLSELTIDKNNPYTEEEYRYQSGAANKRLGITKHIRFEFNGKMHCVFVMRHKTFVAHTRVTGLGGVETKISFIRLAKRTYLDFLPKKSEAYAKHFNDLQHIEYEIKQMTSDLAELQLKYDIVTFI